MSGGDSVLIDLSHWIGDGLVTYPGLPAVRISDHLTHDASRDHYGPSTEFHIGRIEMVANTGTYLDAPFHRYREGADLSRLPLEALAGLPGRVVRRAAGAGRRIGPEAVAGIDVAGRAVLVHTGWSGRWGTEEYFRDHPFLTEDAARLLAESGAALVGIDSLNIDDTDDLQRPAHSLLLGQGIPLVEHLTGLEVVPDEGFEFFAVPPKIEGMGSFPVRAFALVRGG